MPVLHGSVTLRAAATATAASAAFPPRLSTWRPISAARGWLQATQPFRQITGDRLEVNGNAMTVLAVVMENGYSLTHVIWVRPVRGSGIEWELYQERLYHTGACALNSLYPPRWKQSGPKWRLEWESPPCAGGFTGVLYSVHPKPLLTFIHRRGLCLWVEFVGFSRMRVPTLKKKKQLTLLEGKLSTSTNPEKLMETSHFRQWAVYWTNRHQDNFWHQMRRQLCVFILQNQFSSTTPRYVFIYKEIYSCIPSRMHTKRGLWANVYRSLYCVNTHQSFKLSRRSCTHIPVIRVCTYFSSLSLSLSLSLCVCVCVCVVM